MKKYTERWSASLKEGNQSCETEQEFIKIDDNHAQGINDGIVYQILPYDELFKNDKFIGGFKPICIYLSNDVNDAVCFNYAEDGNIEEYLKDKGFTLLILEDVDGYTWWNESKVSEDEFETSEALEVYLKDNDIDYVISGYTIFADLS